MWYAIVIKSKDSQEHYFLIHEPTEGMLFQSLTWADEGECMKGIHNFHERMKKGTFANGKVKTKGERFHREYRDEEGHVWGYGTGKDSEGECKTEYEILKKALIEDGRILNQEDSIPLDPKVMDFLYSLDGWGFETKTSKNEEKQWKNDAFIMWSNKKIRDNFFCKFFELP